MIMNQYEFWPTLLLDVVIKVSLLFIVVWVGSLFMRKRSAAAQHRWWTLGFVGSLLLPAISFVTPTWTLPLLSEPVQVSDSLPVSSHLLSDNPALMGLDLRSGSVSSVNPQGLAEGAYPLTGNVSTELFSQQPTTVAPISSESSSASSLVEILLILWSVGIAACWMRCIWQHLMLKRLLRCCVRLDNQQWHELMRQCSKSLGLHKEVLLLQHRFAHSPVSAGVRNPAVILPESAESWDVDRRRLVLLHELAHIVRRDVFTQTLAGVACGLYWFNPFCWIGLSQMRKYRELACDDLVLSCGQQPAGYADVLLDVARSYRHKSYSTAVGMAHSSNVESRILAILDKTRRHVSLSRGAAGLLLVASLALVCLVGTAQLRSQAEKVSGEQELQEEAPELKEEEPKQEVETPKQLSIVIAEHLMLLDGREVITWGELDERIAALPAGTRVRPEFFFTNGAHRTNQYEPSKDMIWSLRRKHHWDGHSIGSLWPSAGARFDAFKTASDLIPDESRRIEVQVNDQAGQPVDDVEVLLMPMVEESVSFKEHHLTLNGGRINNRLEYEMTLSDKEGRAVLYPPEGNYYMVFLHPEAGFAIRQGKGMEENPKVILLRWATLRSELVLKPGEKQHVSLSTKVAESPGLPVIVFQQHWNSEMVQTEAGTFSFDHVPPILSTLIQRTFPDPDDGGAISIPGATVSLLPGEERQIGLGPLSDAQREHLEDMQRRSEERRKKFEERLKGQASTDNDQETREMRIRILDEAGKPLVGAKLHSNRMRPQGVEGDRIIHSELITDNAGEIKLPIDRKRDTVRLWAGAPGKVSEFVWLNRGPDQQEAVLPQEYEFRLANGTTIGGMVVDDKGKPIQDVHVCVQVPIIDPKAFDHSVNANPRVSNWLTDSFNQPKVKTDSNGRWQIDNAPGPSGALDYEFRLKLDHPDYSSDSRWGGLQLAQGVTTRELRTGDAKIVMSPGTHVRGKVVDQDSSRASRPADQNGWNRSLNYLSDDSEMARQ